MGTRFSNAEGATGTTTITANGGPGTTWNLVSLQISQAGGVVGPNAKVTIWDGPVGTGTRIFSAFLAAPGAGTWTGTGGLGGSTGIIQDIPLPKDAYGRAGLQASTGNAMNIQVTGTGGNYVCMNASLTDGLP